MDDFVAKPIEMTELNRVLKKFVQPKAPEGYMKQVSAQQQKEGGGVPATMVGHGMAGGFAIPGGEDAPVMRQLLTQNNMLLSQNMLLLRHLLGEALTPADAFTADAAVAGPSATPVDEAQPGPEDGAPEDEAIHDHIPGLDMQQSIDNYGGSVHIYHNILRTYYFDIREREPELEKLYEDRDIKNFTIYVHAIKSASRGAGANELGEMALELEEAGKAGDWDVIDRVYPAFREELKRVRKSVGKYVEKYLIQVRKEDSAERLEAFPQEIMDRLRAACDEMDYMEAEALLHTLDEHKYVEPLEAKLQTMLACCAGFEYDKLEEILKAL